jgi:hypothetical protein
MPDTLADANFLATGNAAVSNTAFASILQHLPSAAPVRLMV